MYAEYISGKRVCLVAPGSQTEIMKEGSLIDSYDIVGRVGLYNKLVPDEMGSRTDIRFDNFWCWDNSGRWHVDKKGLYELIDSEGTQIVRHPWCHTEGLNEFAKINDGRIDVSIQEEEIYKDIRKKVSTPTKGICSIFDLLHHDIKELYLVGFSFGRGFSYRRDCFENPYGQPCVESGYVEPSWSVNNLDKWSMTDPDHDIKDEWEAFKRIQDHRLHCDQWLTRLLVS